MQVPIRRGSLPQDRDQRLLIDRVRQRHLSTFAWGGTRANSTARSSRVTTRKCEAG
jgi:hypothetical protein